MDFSTTRLITRPRVAGRAAGLAVAALCTLLAALACTAQQARADDLCVGVTLACVSSYNYPADATGLQLAFSDSSTGAHPAADSIHIAPGVYESSVGFVLNVLSGESVSLFGSGSGQTILRAVDSAADALTISGVGATAIVNGLTVESNATLAGATAVTATNSSTFYHSDLHCRAANCTAYEVIGAIGKFDTGTISADAAGSTAFDVSGTSTSDNYLVVTRIVGFDTGVESQDRDVVMRSVLVDLGGIDGAVGATLDVVSATSERKIDLAGSTIIGEGPNQTGVAADNHSATDDSAIYSRSTAIDLAGAGAAPLDCDEFSGGDALLTTINSAYDTAYAGGCTETITSPLNIKSSPANYANRAARDLRPIWGSPLIDAGEPFYGGSAPYDSHDVNDKDRTRGTKIDIGAVEYQFLRPVITGEIQFSRSGVFDNLVTASLNVADADSDPLEYGWATDKGALPGTPSVTLKLSYAAHGGSVRFTATVKDPSGLTDSESTSITTNVLSLQNLTGSTKPITASRATKFTVLKRRPKGSSFKFSSNTDVRLKFTFKRVYKGRYNKKNRCDVSGRTRRGFKCVVRRKMKRPVLWARIKAGTFWIKPGGQVGKTRLKRGLYDVTGEGSIDGRKANVSLQMRIR